MASAKELSQFLKNVEQRAYKRVLFHVRDTEAALDIVQDSMMRLAQHYGDKSAEELPLLFQRILSNSTMDWFRRQKSYNSLFSNMNDFEPDRGDTDSHFDLLELLLPSSEHHASTETETERTQTLRHIEQEIEKLPARQREAFLLRYWEDMDVAETASAMGCTQGSVKTHCFRAIQALAKALSAKGITL